MKLSTISIKPYILFIILNAFCSSAFSICVAQQNPIASDTKSKQTTYTYKIISSANNSFGYDVYANNKLTIHQPTIPALPGNEGFKTKKNAESVAKLVIDKMKKGQMPPTITIEEMKKLKAIN